MERDDTQRTALDTVMEWPARVGKVRHALVSGGVIGLAFGAFVHYHNPKIELIEVHFFSIFFAAGIAGLAYILSEFLRRLAIAGGPRWLLARTFLRGLAWVALVAAPILFLTMPLWANVK